MTLRRYPGLCVKTSFVFATGDNHRVIGLTFSPIASALGSVNPIQTAEGGGGLFEPPLRQNRDDSYTEKAMTFKLSDFS